LSWQENEAVMEDANFTGKFYHLESPLNEVISHVYHLQTLVDSETMVKHLSPNLEISMLFNFGNPIRFSFNKEPLQNSIQREVAIMGPLKQMLNYELLPGTDAIVVNFRLNGFHRLFNLSLDKLNNDVIHDPDVLMDSTIFSNLWDMLFAMKDMDSRIQLMTSCFASLVQPHNDAIKPLLEGEHYFYNPAISPVKALATDAETTERTIQLHFQKQVGYSSKELMRFLRFKEVIAQMINRQNNNLEIFDLIAEYGYHDQSHLIKDFNYFMGTTPKKFFKTLKDNNFCITGQDDLKEKQ